MQFVTVSAALFGELVADFHHAKDGDGNYTILSHSVIIRCDEMIHKTGVYTKAQHNTIQCPGCIIHEPGADWMIVARGITCPHFGVKFGVPGMKDNTYAYECFAPLVIDMELTPTPKGEERE